MIYKMVSNLNKRIESKGGTFEEWFKLIRSYLVLGENELAFDQSIKSFYLIFVVILSLLFYLITSYLIKAFKKTDFKLKY